MTYQEIEQIKNATYTQTIRASDNSDQCRRDYDRANCIAFGNILQRIELAEKSYKASYSEELKAAMWEDLFNFVKNQVEYSFGYYAAKCEEHGKEKG